MLTNETKIRVRYAETDQMGVVHHSTYLLYFEIGRTELLRNLGTTYRKIEKEGIMLPVISVKCNFSGPAHYDDELIIQTTCKDKPGVKVRFYYNIINNEEIICTGYSDLAFTNAITRRPIRPPDWFLQFFDSHL